MFAGIGGFRSGFTNVGGFQCIGHCEIDKYAHKSYINIHDIKEDELYFDDARTIDPDQLPDFDLLCGGFPCQAFSQAGKRQGFDDARGTLFFEIARLAQAKRPPLLFLENVPGLLSHDQGRTFSTILGALSDLGYHVEWTVLNSAHFGVPQARKRVFLICYLDERCGGKILPVFGAGGKAVVQVLAGRQGDRIYDSEGSAITQTANCGGLGGKTGFYMVGFNRKVGITDVRDLARTVTATDSRGLNRNQTQNAVVVTEEPLPIKEATKKGYKNANVGDSVNLGFAGNNTRRGRVGKDIAHTIDTGSSTQGVVEGGGRIRRLHPRECLRLQGFDEKKIDVILDLQSDAQAYKQAGNSVTVNVIEAIAHNIRATWEDVYGWN